MSPCQSKRAIYITEIAAKEQEMVPTLDQMESQTQIDEAKFERLIQKLRTEKRELRDIMLEAKQN